jgi:hypothetical protein
VELKFFESDVKFFRNVFVAFIKPIAVEAFWPQSDPVPNELSKSYTQKSILALKFFVRFLFYDKHEGFKSCIVNKLGHNYDAFFDVVLHGSRIN